MKPHPQDWPRLADIDAVLTTREPPRDLQLIDAPRTAGTRALRIDDAPRAAPAPPALTGTVRPLRALLLLLVALIPWWLLAGHGGQGVRGLLLVDGALATLLATTLHYTRRARVAEAATSAARRQLATILGGMGEGLFLLGRDLRLSANCSGSMARLLRVAAPSGRRFEDVLRPLLDAKRLAATLAYLQRLLDPSATAPPTELVNPLSQLEVSFANAHGRSERCYLSFSFRRVAGSGTADEGILGVVADVTDQVLLARELEHARADGDSQAGLLLQLVRADPLALVAFLDDADSALRKSNALLTAPGSDQPQLQKKLQGMLRELEALTAEAELLPLTSYAQRLHGIDELLCGLRARASLTGNDFLPVVIRLDELMSHAVTMRSIHQHVVLLRAASAALAALDCRDSPITSGPAVLELT